MTRNGVKEFSHDWLMPLLIGMPLLLMLQWLDADLWISSQFFDPSGRHFPWKDHWLLKTVLHDGIRNLSVILAIGLIVLGVAGLFSAPLRRHRQIVVTLLAGMLLSAGLVALIKSLSIPACPHDLLIYGGTLPRIGIFDSKPADYVAGHCWPGGNASSAFCLFGLYFAARARSCLAAARLSLAAVVLTGLLLSMVQVMRGMHFLSHEVWTALICWYVNLLVFKFSDLFPVPGQGPSDMFAHQRRGVVDAFPQRCDSGR